MIEKRLTGVAGAPQRLRHHNAHFRPVPQRR